MSSEIMIRIMFLVSCFVFGWFIGDKEIPFKHKIRIHISGTVMMFLALAL